MDTPIVDLPFVVADHPEIIKAHTVEDQVSATTHFLLVGVNLRTPVQLGRFPACPATLICSERKYSGLCKFRVCEMEVDSGSRKADAAWSREIRLLDDDLEGLYYSPKRSNYCIPLPRAGMIGKMCCPRMFDIEQFAPGFAVQF